MHSEQVNGILSFHLRNIAFLRFSNDSDYIDIISPFTRMYLVTEGAGWLIIGNQKIILEAGHLYLIPGYTSCTYHFEKGLAHYYIHTGIDFPDGLNPYNIYKVKYKVAECPLDISLFERILQLNPDLELPHHHPDVYQKKPWLNKKATYKNPGHHLETLGILYQIFSRFTEDLQNTLSNMLKYNIQPILIYINNNLHGNIAVETLAGIACFSKDHFSKVFKAITGLPPTDYIIRKRLERAQFLLMTTELSQKEIIEQTGFKSLSYFSRIFKKHTGYSPDSYRKQQG